MSNEYEMQRSASNPNLVVPGTGHVSASYAEQRAAGINYTDNAHMVHFKLMNHQAQQRWNQAKSWNKPVKPVAKPMRYSAGAAPRAPTLATADRVRATGVSGGARNATAMPVPAVVPKKAPSVVKPLMAPAMAVVMFALKYLGGFVLAYLLGWGLLSHLAHFMLGSRLQAVVVFGAMALNVLWLVFRLAWATGRGLKNLGVVKTAKGTSLDKDGKLAVNL
ncbi:hypothetical protein [Paraburkholderia fungorum]|jgi:hypothetical protein|uniref:hypothetical protein n=1 Tax=Paraburkholderia fungorum TaxID=134537 RepID=UPI000D493BC9|nr:hypothetical protein [Paraburkholderia fungorum]PRZ50684.1 hypothetical protein BX589_124122 [Paraburkholderia fungorum]